MRGDNAVHHQSKRDKWGKAGVHGANSGSGKSVANRLLFGVLGFDEISMVNVNTPGSDVSLATMTRGKFQAHHKE
jgi:hypothetical protein